MMQMIPFNKPYLSGNELKYIEEAHSRCQLAGDGYFTEKCSKWLENNTGSSRVLLTHSCTAALEMAAILLDINPGDEIVMPSYTFVSSANAFALRGGVPVFVDIREDTLNIDERLIEDAISPRTKAILVVHYAGVPCRMNTIMSISKKYGVYVIEDAAQGVMSKYRDKALGSIGDLGCYSFHETKNIISGEGGALLINNPAFKERAEIIREKGTNRSSYFRGLVDKYTWVDLGSSFLLGELISAFLAAQLERSKWITDQRIKIWKEYHKGFRELEKRFEIRRPLSTSNGHMYYLVLKSPEQRDAFISKMAEQQINCVFHYIPLHSSPFGRRVGRCVGDLRLTDILSQRIVRLPLWLGVEEHQKYIIECANSIVDSLN